MSTSLFSLSLLFFFNAQINTADTSSIFKEKKNKKTKNKTFTVPTQKYICICISTMTIK